MLIETIDYVKLSIKTAFAYSKKVIDLEEELWKKI